jgi:hypothetical protein
MNPSVADNLATWNSGVINSADKMNFLSIILPVPPAQKDKTHNVNICIRIFAMAHPA